MKNTRITLKRIEYSERLSQETNAFAADVYFDGKKVGYAENDGWGGSTNVMPFPETRDKFKEAEAYALTLPETDYGTFKVKSDLEHVVDTLLEDWITAKDQAKYEKKIQKDCIDHLCYGNKEHYMKRHWLYTNKKKVPIAALQMDAKGREMLKKAVAEAKAEGYEIFNKNLSKEVLS